MNILHNPRRVAVFLAVGIAMVAGAASLPAQVSLSTVVELAQRNSSAVKLAGADVQKAASAFDQARDVFAPSMTMGSGLPAFPAVGFTGGVPSILNANVQSLAFSFSQVQFIRAARAGFDAASLSLKDAREQVALDASTDYIELDAVESELDAAHRQGDFANRLVEIERERTGAGVDPLTELFQAQLTTAELKLKRLHLETRAGTLQEQLAALTGLPASAMVPDHASIPEIPEVKADNSRRVTDSVRSAQFAAVSKQKFAKGDLLDTLFPQISFSALYSRSTTILNDFNRFYSRPIPANNFSSGFSIQTPVLDFGRRAKARQSAAESLRATVEAEQAQHQNDILIATLSGNLRELDALAEIATLKQQIAAEQLKAVQSQLEFGNGSGSGPGSPPQLTPKAEQLAHISERKEFIDALDASSDLSKARLSLLRALGHMDDWLRTLSPAPPQNK